MNTLRAGDTVHFADTRGDRWTGTIEKLLDDYARVVIAFGVAPRGHAEYLPGEVCYAHVSLLTKIT